MSISYNKEQLDAIYHKDGPMLVLAGPGCGKTAVITGRLNELIKSGISASNILVVTFTVAAAAEMKERFMKTAPENSYGITISTFHGVFYYILRTEYNLRNGSILAEDRKFLLLKNILESNYDDAYYENELAKNVAQEISLVKGSGISSKNYYSQCLPSEVFSRVFNEYRVWLNENRILDFDDINTATYQLFKTRPDVLKKWQRKFKYILVDEFQDINRLQYMIIKMLSLPENNLFIVGDDDQSIYRFRGSNPEIMLNFPKEFEDCRSVFLSCNYRSTPDILNGASKVISKNEKRFKKNLSAYNKKADAIDTRIFDNIWQEMDELSADIRKAHENGTPYREMAVLVRTNFGARAALERLLSDRIPYIAKQDVPCIYDHFIAKDIIAYMDVAAGSRKKSDILRIINKPNRYVARAALYEQNFTFDQLYIYYEDRDWMCRRIEELEENIHMLASLPPYGAIQFIRKVIGYDEYIADYALERGIAAEELFNLIDDIMESARLFRNTEDWKKHICEYSEKVKNKKSDPEDENSVIISTLHGCKGKEYDIVFILDVNEGVIPFHKAANQADIEEERRLFYVGMTRARKKLHIFAVKERYEKKQKISSFLNSLIADEK